MARRPAGDAERPALRSVANALRMVAMLAEAEQPLGVSELAGALDVAPSTAHRLLATLVAHGFAARVPGRGRYRPGPALVRLSARPTLVEHLRLRAVAHPVLERLAAVTRETAHLAVLDGFSVVGIDHAESSQPVVARHPVGSRVPAHATAVGQALLAYLPEAADAVAAAGLARLTGHTITDPAAFRQTLAEIRRRGYAVNVRQWYAETAGVAAPVHDPDGEVAAALGISGPAARIDRPGVLAELGEHARAAAMEITGRLARQGPGEHA